jgi:hypothetical protein
MILGDESDFLDSLDEPGTPTHTNNTSDQGLWEANLTAGEDALPNPAGVVRQQCASWIAAAETLRHTEWPPFSAIPERVAEALVQARARLDSLEAILGSVMALRSATAANARALEQAADDAWNDRAGTERRTARRDFEGARERYAWWELDVRPQRTSARQARLLADDVKAAHDRIRLAYDGLNELRRDLSSRLTHLRWERSMDQ